MIEMDSEYDCRSRLASTLAEVVHLKRSSRLIFKPHEEHSACRADKRLALKTIGVLFYQPNRVPGPRRYHSVGVGSEYILGTTMLPPEEVNMPAHPKEVLAELLSTLFLMRE